MLRGQRNSKKQGDVGLGAAIGWFSMQGYTVCVPLTDSQDFDLAVEMEGALRKVQVKTTWRRSRHGVFEVNLKVGGGNRSGTGKVKVFDAAKVDLLFVLTDEGTRYLIPSSAVCAGRQLNLGKRYEKYKLGA